MTDAMTPTQERLICETARELRTTITQEVAILTDAAALYDAADDTLVRSITLVLTVGMRSPVRDLIHRYVQLSDMLGDAESAVQP